LGATTLHVFGQHQLGWLAAFAFSAVTAGIGGFIVGGVFLTGYAVCPDTSTSGNSSSHTNPSGSSRGPR